MRWQPVLAVLLAACASANVGGNNPGDDDDDDPPKDAPDPDLDAPDGAPPIDAAVPVSLVQTGATNVVATQIGCQQTNPLTNFTTPNSYYRTFPLSDFNITTPLHVTEVKFEVERSTAGNGVSQPAQLILGTYTGTINAASFALASLTPIAAATIAIPNGATSVTTPITAFSPTEVTLPPGQVMYVELRIPDGRPAGNIFYIGSNAGTEMHPSYIMATDCSIASPTQYVSAVGASPVIRILLSVNGTH
ncbi:MAG: hypothetical protein ABI867_06385 [Kofleriaceae bacterium]